MYTVSVANENSLEIPLSDPEVPCVRFWNPIRTRDASSVKFSCSVEIAKIPGYPCVRGAEFPEEDSKPCGWE